MMRTFGLCASLALLAACGGSTAVDSTGTSPAARYNFAVIDGANQSGAAGTTQLSKPITAQLTRDPNGKFATRVFDFFAPAVAYAQALTLPGTPVVGAIVCGREAVPGEPTVVPLCAFTLGDGKVVNVVVPGTKAGTYNILFTAQVQSQEPVKDSTTVTVKAGTADTLRVFGLTWVFADGPRIGVAEIVIRAADQYGNTVDVVPQVSGAGGFIVSPDSISSDATERNAMITVTVGNRSATSQMASLYDFRKSQWRLQGACTTEGTNGWQFGVIPIDSVAFDATTTMVSYVSLKPSDAAVPVLTWTGIATFFLRDGSVVPQPLNSLAPFVRQAFDTVYTVGLIPLVRDVASPTRRYVAPAVRGACPFVLEGSIRKRITLTAN